MRKLIIFLLLLFGLYAVWAYYPLPDRHDLIPGDYFALRKRFLKSTENHEGELSSHIIEAKGPNGEDLFIDTFWIGSKTPKKVLLHISGTHGVEGYSGSAIQSALLNEDLTVSEDSAIIFIHALNPWGMAHVRRFNESNVDINRNFITDPNRFTGAPESYKKIESFLNPKGSPSKIDLFFPSVVSLIIQHGFTTLKQAIAGGQYEYPEGIYFGGEKIEESNAWLRDFTTQYLTEVEELYAIEVHTGLGESGKDVLFWPLTPTDPKTESFEKRIGETLATDDPSEGVGFKTPGDLQNELPKLIPNTEVFWILQEFGAYGPVPTLRSLRNENMYHFSTPSPDVNHWSKRELMEAFSPGAKKWQDMIIDRGLSVGKKFISLINE